MKKNITVNTKEKAKAADAKAKASYILASTKRILSRLLTSLASIALKQDDLAAVVKKGKEATAALIEAAVEDRRAIWAEQKTEAERKAVGQGLYDALTKDHGLTPQRASDVLKLVGIKIGNKNKVVALDVSAENIEQLFLLADKLEGQDPRRVCALLSRAYGKGRKVYPANKSE
jgi:hypothetical protein